MKLLSILASAALLSVTLAGSSEAKVFDFSFFGTDVSGSGVITTGNTGSPYSVTIVSGTIYDSDVSAGPFNITTLSSYASSDNLLYYATQPFVDFGGVSFSTNTGGDFNLGLGGGGPYGYVLNSSVLNPGGYAGVVGSTDITLSVSAVPEPSTWVMLLLGCCGIGYASYRRTRKAAGSLATA